MESPMVAIVVVWEFDEGDISPDSVQYVTRELFESNRNRPSGIDAVSEFLSDREGFLVRGWEAF